jgi:calcineurin-like phosphoesterase family protein
MSRDIWIVSDTHLGHENILKFTDSATGNLMRGHLFDNVDQMDEYMLEKWNSVVKPGDIVYHLGDVFMGDKDRFKRQWPKFNGSKRLIVGNHDDIKFLSSGGFFSKVQMWRMFPEFGLMLSHVFHCTKAIYCV